MDIESAAMEADYRDRMKLYCTENKGFTVRELIWELQKYPPDMKVANYGKDGCVYDIMRVIKDGRKLVVF